ncbi:MAG: efflux system, outer rane lipoprotein NodT family, partial [Proteobacteria bacterium]|nr:efflux system, outer rane lipoprotein NodT family [Pseudomonadota bacterium]
MRTDFPKNHRRAAPSARWTLLASALLVALGGCAALPPESSDSSDPSEFSAVAVPNDWSAAPASVTSAATPLAQWWLRFDDAQLSRLVSDALHANTSVRSAQAALRQARALRDVSAAALWPTLGSSASAQRGKSDGNPASNSFSAGLDASWELDVFGGKRSALDASEASARASAASLADVQVSIAAEVALAYITLRDAQQRLEIASDNLASQQQTLQITRWRLQAGLATELDVEQARTSAEQTNALLPPLQTTIAQTAHALAVLSGRPPASLSTQLAAHGPLPQAPGDLALSLPADTLRQRPDVRAAEHQVSAALANVAQAEAARQPNFTIDGSLGLTALTLGALGDGASVMTSLLGSV